jgi:hypothetical protein
VLVAATNKEGLVNESGGQLAHKTGLSEKMCNRACKALTSLGWLVTVTEPRHSPDPMKSRATVRRFVALMHDAGQTSDSMLSLTQERQSSPERQQSTPERQQSTPERQHAVPSTVNHGHIHGDRAPQQVTISQVATRSMMKLKHDGLNASQEDLEQELSRLIGTDEIWCELYKHTPADELAGKFAEFYRFKHGPQAGA